MAKSTQLADDLPTLPTIAWKKTKPAITDSTIEFLPANADTADQSPARIPSGGHRPVRRQATPRRNVQIRRAGEA